MEIFGIGLLQVVAVIVALIITYIVARILKKTLETVFEKAPFPEDLEKGLTKISKYVVYLVGLFVIISIMLTLALMTIFLVKRYTSTKVVEVASIRQVNVLKTVLVCLSTCRTPVSW